MGLDIRILNLNKKGVSLTDKYTDTLWFPTATAQENYFEECQIVAIGNSDKYLEPATKSIVVDYTVSGILSANYIMFRNSSHSTKWFYAFVDSVVYETMTSARINFTIDIIQTYMFNIEFKPCMVEREHSITDGIGTNIVPENLELGDYVSTDVTGLPDIFTKCVTVVFCSGNYITTCAGNNDSSDPIHDDGYAGFSPRVLQGVFNGLGMYFSIKTKSGNIIECNSQATMINLVNNPSADWGDCGFSQYQYHTLPKMLENMQTGFNKCEIIGVVSMPISLLWQLSATYLAHPNQFNLDYTPGTLTKSKPTNLTTIDGYLPKNKKLLTYPFNLLYVTNNQGGYCDYKYEYFLTDDIQFDVDACIGLNPSLILIPKNYKGDTLNNEEILTITNYPQCSYVTDIFKGWLVNNAGSLLTTAGTLALTVATGGSAAPLLAGSAVSTMGSLMNAATQPDQAKNVSSGSTQQAIGRMNFTFMKKTISRSYAERIDLFFSKYGYATKKVKIPNISGRSAFNYVKTVDCLITGSCPSDILKELETIHNNGITYWKQAATFGVITQDNV